MAQTPTFAPGGLVVEQYVLTNPALNYAQFLLRAVLPTILHVVTAISAGYAVGSEFSSRSRRAWLATAGGSPLAALVGKLAPLFGIFVLMMVVGCRHRCTASTPCRFEATPSYGRRRLSVLIAYLALGALFQLLVRKLAVGLVLTGIFCSPAFGFAGVGFPILAMNGFAQFWGDLMPLRWYIQILFDQAVRGLPTSASVQPFAVLGALPLGLAALAWLRLRLDRAIDLSRPALRRPSVAAPSGHRRRAGRGVACLLRQRLRACSV